MSPKTTLAPDGLPAKAKLTQGKTQPETDYA